MDDDEGVNDIVSSEGMTHTMRREDPTKKASPKRAPRGANDQQDQGNSSDKQSKFHCFRQLGSFLPILPEFPSPRYSLLLAVNLTAKQD